MQIILSTRNPSKAEQIKAIFIDSPITVLTLADAGIEGEGIEDGTTLQENALKKAMFVYDRSNPKAWAMADDTGIFIDVLNGLPGVNTAHWNGGAKTTEEMTQYVLKQLEGISDRSATFETVVAVISPQGDHRFFSGKVCGKLLEAPRGSAQPKMPYAPIFIPNENDLTWAEMTIEQENKISHRGKAFRQAREFLEKFGK